MRKTRGRVTPIDQKIGERIKFFRMTRRITVKELSHAINLSAQQIHKYEKGLNRVSASKISTIAEILNVPIDAFYSSVNETLGITASFTPDRLTAEILLGLSKINNPKQKRILGELIKALIAGQRDNLSQEPHTLAVA